MKIEKNSIFIGEEKLFFGMSYEAAKACLDGILFAKMSPDEEGDGHIILKRQMFYGLKGTCTFYFQKSKLKRVGMVPDWGMYNFRDEHGNSLPIEEAIKRIEKENAIELSRQFTLVGKSPYGNKAFQFQQIYVYTAISRDGDQYSILIKGAEEQ